MTNKMPGVSWGVNVYIKVFFLLSFLAFFLFPIAFGWGAGGGDVSPMELLSLAWFLILATISCLSEKLYWSLAPPAILFTPNAVNGLLPGAAMGPAFGNPEFSFITHVDIYLLIGVLLYCDFMRRVKVSHLILIYVLIFLYIISLVVSANKDLLPVFWFGSFQLRYLIVLTLLFSFANPLRSLKLFSVSLVATSFLVFLEAFVFSFLFGSSVRLESGNYGVNLLGHFFAAIAVFLYFFWRCAERQNYFFMILFFALLFLFTVLTGTRFSLLILFFSFGLAIFWKQEGVVAKLFYIFMVIIFIVAFFSFSAAGSSIANGVFHVWKGFNGEGALVVTSDSSSLITRLTLWKSTVEMIMENFWWGISPGEWPFQKGQYGIPFDSVLDPHNEILNLIVNYGALTGFFYVFIIYILPFTNLKKVSKKMALDFPWLALLFVFFLAGLSNSITWKHQLAFLIPYAALVVLFYKDDVVRNYVE